MANSGREAGMVLSGTSGRHTGDALTGFGRGYKDALRRTKAEAEAHELAVKAAHAWEGKDELVAHTVPWDGNELNRNDLNVLLGNELQNPALACASRAGGSQSRSFPPRHIHSPLE